MTSLYRNTGLWTRSAAYLAVIAAAFLWGVFELWRASQAGSGEASSGAMFGVLFIGGAIYALWQIVGEWRDVAVSLDRDADGALVATVWQPTGPKKVTGDFRNWRFHVALASRNARLYFLYADNAAMPRPLRFELRKGIDLAGLRTIAPGPVEEYEAAIAPAAKVS
jgi:hypothetical protein